MKKLLLSAAALALSAGTANAHLVTFGWQETAAGTVLWAEHWHGDLSSAYSDNGGIHITDSMGATITAPWTGVINNTLVGALGLTGYAADPGNAGSGTYNDWMFTAPIPLGNGTYDFFTGTGCCVDTMTHPEEVTLTGITNVGPGIGNPGAVPEPATWAMMLAGFGLLGASMRRKQTAQVGFGF